LFLVSFRAHDGYFRADSPEIRDAIRRAAVDQREISFSFDRDLKIICVD
jgi:hypothetical protein